MHPLLRTVCYHPLFLFNDHGDCLAAKLRPGNVSSTDDWEELLVPEIDRQQAEGQRVAFRADAAFARPGELFPRVGFIVTNLPLPNQARASRPRIGRDYRVTASERTKSASS